MISLTKNHQTESAIKEMTADAFPHREAVEIKELTEGFFNVAYRIKLSDGREVILKIAPPKEASIMSYEKNLMYAEVQSMRLVSEKTTVPVPKVYYYSAEKTSDKSLCQSDYFFMSRLTGDNYHSAKSSLSVEEQYQIDYEVGEYNRQINEITGTNFGYYAFAANNSGVWKTVFEDMVEGVLKDGNIRNIDIGIAYDALRKLIKEKLYALEAVKAPKLVHGDLWEGNVFISKGHVEGIIDFERTIWGDPLMEYAFRRHCRNNTQLGFMNGYGKTEQNQGAKIRSTLYDIYLYLIMTIECDYRQYSDDSQYIWAKKMLKDTVNSLVQI